MAKATVTDEAAAFVFGGDPATESPRVTAKNTKKATAKNTVKTTSRTTKKNVGKGKNKIRVSSTDGDKTAAAAVLFGDMPIDGKVKMERYTLDLEPELARQFNEVAKLTGQTKSKLLRHIMKTAFDAIQRQVESK